MVFKGLAEPGTGVLPGPVGDGSGKPQGASRLRDRKAAEQVEMSDLRGLGIFLPKTGKQFVDRQEEVRVLCEGAGLIEQLKPSPAARPLEPVPIAGMIDEDSTHRLGSGCEEMHATFDLLVANQPQVGLVDQGCRAQGVSSASAAIFAAASLHSSS